MPHSTGCRSISAMRGSRKLLVAAPLALALLSGAPPPAGAADAESRDVRVNLDVLDSLGPPPADNMPITGAIHLHPPTPKAEAKPAPVAAAPAAPAGAAKTRTAAKTPATASSPPAVAAAPSTAGAAPAVPPAAPAAPPAAPAAHPAAANATATAAATPAAPKTPLAPARVLFASGAVDLPESAKGELNAVADWLDANQQARLQITAYASGGPDEANAARRTSLTRALAVRSYLIGRGVSQTRMEVRALGNRSENGDPADRVDVVAMDR
jgi:outer membrane protein OmpA-like peptidoglycan-associated protein